MTSVLSRSAQEADTECDFAVPYPSVRLSITCWYSTTAKGRNISYNFLSIGSCITLVSTRVTAEMSDLCISHCNCVGNSVK